VVRFQFRPLAGLASTLPRAGGDKGGLTAPENTDPSVQAVKHNKPPGLILSREHIPRSCFRKDLRLYDFLRNHSPTSTPLHVSSPGGQSSEHPAAATITDANSAKAAVFNVHCCQ
jgi:hypothetical protein